MNSWITHEYVWVTLLQPHSHSHLTGALSDTTTALSHEGPNFPETTCQTLKASLMSFFSWRKYLWPFSHISSVLKVLPGFFFTYNSNPSTLADLNVMNTFSHQHIFLPFFFNSFKHFCHVFLFIIEKQLPLTHLYSYYCQSTLSAPKPVIYKTTVRQSWFFVGI